MRTADFDYELPQHYIAQAPADPRDSCKLLVMDQAGRIEHRIFRDIIDYLQPGDLLVANETRVLPARLLGRKRATGGQCECLLLNKHEGAPDCADEQTWECLVKPGKRLKEGAVMEFCDADGQVILAGEVLGILPENGARIVRLAPQGNAVSVDLAMHLVGRTPLPPYITDYQGDQEMYQTVYSKTERSAAAPTAGLHFTEELLQRIHDNGVGFATVDLEVGLGTFRTVTEEDAADHDMHVELYTVPQETVDAVQRTKEAGGRVIAVGTTSVRSLESAAASGRLCAQDRASTKLFIMPGYEFKVVDAMITNFHVPRSTLLMLVSAFSGREHVMAAYEEAKRKNYRFFSFGDAMLLL
ncbi:MAG: tRNA preQ1(34) S-adenosylmethionine ribosyltransferase-isomerase QueA [Coriobacteriales bacterium]